MPKLHLPPDVVERWVEWVVLVWHPKSLVMDGKFIFRTLKRIALCSKGLVKTRPNIKVISALRAIMAKEGPKRASWPPNMKLFGKVATAAAAPATAATAPATETAAVAPATAAAAPATETAAVAPATAVVASGRIWRNKGKWRSKRSSRISPPPSCTRSCEGVGSQCAGVIVNTACLWMHEQLTNVAEEKCGLGGSSTGPGRWCCSGCASSSLG